MGRYALLIATGEYQDPLFRRLRSPAQDVRGLARVLEDPTIGGFDQVVVLEDRPDWELRQAVDDILADRTRDDTVVVYFSCHGMKDRFGRLHFVTTNTVENRLPGTSLASAFVSERLEHSQAGGRLLLLDCCNSGAFARGMGISKSPPRRPLDGEILENRGYVCITACDAYEYAFEGPDMTLENPRNSLFTDALINGLLSGDADLDRDGWVEANELYLYTYGKVRETAEQTPSFFAAGIQGPFRVSRAPLKAQPPVSPFISDSFPQSYDDDLRGGGGLFLAGVSLSKTLAAYLPEIERRATQGIPVQVLLVDPTSAAADLTERRRGFPQAERKAAIRRTIKTLSELQERTGDTIKIRTTYHELRFGAVLANVGTPDAMAYVQYYPLGIRDHDRMRLVLRPDDGDLYELHQRQLYDLWAEAVPVGPPAGVPDPRNAPPQDDPADARGEASPDDAETTLEEQENWLAIVGSPDVRDFEGHLDRWPRGRHAAQCRAAIIDLS
ncbi:hypothetical protein F4553_001230 [Allocatelliglobosispora scoriae]|uniref:Caspase family protein n=1 Tax=Allocatelliglobosispora scoriae TaxID=643052 RepID=A0A841BLW3_9ACTN|nr:caspase family protein [Allocatelliglobosispora scoriae]MBB5867851.1 hypothetical protein [Allocatelliglobosispora scoriae]